MQNNAGKQKSRLKQMLEWLTKKKSLDKGSMLILWIAVPLILTISIDRKGSITHKISGFKSGDELRSLIQPLI